MRGNLPLAPRWFPPPVMSQRLAHELAGRRTTPRRRRPACGDPGACRPGRPASGRDGRVGRAGRRAANCAEGPNRRRRRGLGAAACRGSPGGPPRALRDLPVHHERRQPLPLRADHDHLRTAGDGAERRRRFRGAARSRLRRLLRLRRLPLRDHGQRPFGPSPAGGDRDPDRGRRGGAGRPLARPHVVAAARRLPRDRDALLPPGVRHLRQQRERRPE